METHLFTPRSNLALSNQSNPILGRKPENQEEPNTDTNRICTNSGKPVTQDNQDCRAVR